MSVETLPSEQSFRRQYWERSAVDDDRLEDEWLRAANKNEPGTMHITEVTLRDGQQQRTNEVTTDQRLEIFDSIVTTGVDRIEIGHLGNEVDQQLATEIIRRVAQKEHEDERYANVKLQVLFGSQEELIKEGTSVLRQAFQENYGDNWEEVMADKVVVHVYDRLDENLRNTSSTPYTDEESAERVCIAAKHALDAGFKQFSVSGEGATAATVDEAIQFHRAVNSYLFDNGAESVNVNLANTYGYSVNEEWHTSTLSVFNAAVKHGYDKGKVSTSIHTHNDANTAVNFAIDAVVAGFDRVEGTHIGMGERVGNVSTADAIAEVLEQSKHKVDSKERAPSRIARLARPALKRTVNIDQAIMDNLENWYMVGEKMSEVFGPHAEYRWHRTVLGNPYFFDNGSGPHDQVMAMAIEDPVKHPPYRKYGWGIATVSMMGRRQADLLALGDPEAIDAVTVGGHASGGKTRKIKNGELVRASDEKIEQARVNFEKYKLEIGTRAVRGTFVLAA